MPRRPKDTAGVRLESLDLGYLALFVGMRMNEQVLETLHASGFEHVRHAHGYVFQHLLGDARSITELATLLEVTQQAASKSVAELRELGYLEDGPSDDARVRKVRLSERGRAVVAKAREARADLEKRLERAHGKRALDDARELLADVLESLGGADAVRARKVRAPR